MLHDSSSYSIILIYLGVFAIIWLIIWLFLEVPKKQKNTVYPMGNVGVSKNKQENDGKNLLYYFYHPRCQHCVRFMPTWKELAEKLSNLHQLTTKMINVSDPVNENLVFYYNVTAYPTIILVTGNGNIEYNGDRTIIDLYRFVSSNINMKSS
jgi:thiol-disulfide isomerase/thioredoxin